MTAILFDFDTIFIIKFILFKRVILQLVLFYLFDRLYSKCMVDGTFFRSDIWKRKKSTTTRNVVTF